MLLSHPKMCLLMSTNIRRLIHLMKTCRMSIAWLLNITFCHSVITWRRHIRLSILHLLSIIKWTAMCSHARSRCRWRMISWWYWQIIYTVSTIHITICTDPKSTWCRIPFNRWILRPSAIPLIIWIRRMSQLWLFIIVIVWL